jgi:putative BNR repeat neuraminidase/PKD domain-containing protein
VAALCAAVAFAAVVTESAGESPRRGFSVTATPMGPGGWSWFADPRAIHYRGRTYVGWLAPGGDVLIGAYTSMERVRTVLGGNHRTNDHDNPALLVLPGGRLAVFYSHHDSGPMRYRVSRRPGDITAWGRERVVRTNVLGPPNKGWTYPNPVRLRREGNRIYLFWRAANWNPAFSTWRPGGRWSRARTLIRVPGQRPYVKFASNGRDSIYFAFNRGHPRETHTGVHFAKYRQGSFFRADGTRITTKRSLPLYPAQADTVYRRRPGQSSAWVHDVAIGRRGRPVIVHAVFPSPRRHVYKYSRWTGRRWVTHTITGAGGPITPIHRERFYSGGLTLHHGDPSVVYLSRRVGSVHEVERWRTRDGGRSWSRRPITSDSPVNNVRPVRPRGLPRGKEEVIWMRGHYRRYTSFQTSVVTGLVTAAPRPPVAAFRAALAASSAGYALRLSRTTSDARASPAVQARWDFGDGTSSSAEREEHRYARPGRYFPKLTVVDAAGRRDVLVREVVLP